jgi:Arc/MetJ-type ribon-helix-helix transcriptional regulator
MATRVNVNIPEALFQQSNVLVEKGYFSNFSELVREGLREEVRKYEEKTRLLSDDERKLFALIKEANEKGLLVDEKEMKKHGLCL